MVITDHFIDVNDNTWFTVSTPEYDISENIQSQHMLSIDPTQIELYQYLHATSIRHLAIPSPSTSTYDIQENIQCMITDYFEVECYTGALELIETSLISHRKPSTPILQAMVNLLLRKREDMAQEQYKSYWTMTDKTHDILLKIVALFGPSPFDWLWNTFDSPHSATQAKKQQQQQQQQLLYQDPSDATYEDALMDTSDHGDSLNLDELGAFDDFWDFVSQCFKYDTTLLQAKSYLHVLDTLITVLEQDFRSKRDCSGNVKKTTFLKTLRKNMIGGWDRFEHYLNILLGPFTQDDDDDDALPPMIHTKQKEYAGRLLNLMIAISRYNISLSITALADQAFRKSIQLGPDCLTNLVQYIVFDAFILQLCDAGFVNANWSAVPQQYQYLKNQRESNNLTLVVVGNTSRWLEKWINAYLKLRPSKIQWSTIYLHVWMIKQYYHSILKISSLRCEQGSGTTVIRGCNDLDQDALSALLDDSHIQTWLLQQVTTWIKQCRRTSNPDDNKQWQQRMDWLLDTFTF